MESNLGDTSPELPRLVDALQELMTALIQEGHAARDKAEDPDTPPSWRALHNIMRDVKLATAFQLSRLIDDHQKGKTV